MHRLDHLFAQGDDVGERVDRHQLGVILDDARYA